MAGAVDPGWDMDPHLCDGAASLHTGTAAPPGARNIASSSAESHNHWSNSRRITAIRPTNEPEQTALDLAQKLTSRLRMSE